MHTRLTCHLGLNVPDGAHITVAGEQRTWSEGRVLVLDDSFVHWVNNTAATDRYILLFHVWHPDLVRQRGYEAGMERAAGM